ncbi:hypothetical protein C8Q73DRAFT_668257 [Cubamyces lactineus]|nr:hypothetical protein C8Q73DRAFT_668257 [Cubamyces lactineus]
MSDLAFNVWGVVAGVIGLFALIPAFLTWLQTRLPTARLPHLIASFIETERLFAAAIRDGLFTNENDLFYAAETWSEDVRNWWNGLSGRIAARCLELNNIRKRLAARNSRERRRLASLGVVTELPLMSDHKGEVNVHRFGTTSTGGALTIPIPVSSSHISPSRVQHATTLLPLYNVGNHMLPRATSSGQAAPIESSIPGQDDVEDVTSDPNDQAAYHMISEADLQDLLTFALSPLTDSTRQRATRSRLRAVSRLLRRIYGMRPRGAALPIDPESLLPPTDADSGDHNDDGPEDV